MKTYLTVSIISFLVSTTSFSAEIALTSSEFEQMKLVNTMNGSGYFTFPAVLIYSNDGSLSYSVMGKKIYEMKSYIKTEQNSQIIQSPNIKGIDDMFGNKRKYDKKLILFLSLDSFLCPPCITIKNEFSKIEAILSKEHQVIYVNVKDE